MRIVIGILAATAFACGGTDGGGASVVSGTASGASFGSVVDAQAIVLNNSTCGGVNPPANEIVIALSSVAGVCADVTSNKRPANAATLLILLDTFWLNPGSGAPPASSPALTTKTYSVNDSSTDANGFGVIVAAAFDSVDGTCHSKLANGSIVGARAGTVTLTGISGSNVSGSFSLVFGSDTLTGTFSTGVCGISAAQACSFLSNDADGTCG